MRGRARGKLGTCNQMLRCRRSRRAVVLRFPDSLPTFEYSPSRGESPLCFAKQSFCWFGENPRAERLGSSYTALSVSVTPCQHRSQLASSRARSWARPVRDPESDKVAGRALGGNQAALDQLATKQSPRRAQPWMRVTASLEAAYATSEVTSLDSSNSYST